MAAKMIKGLVVAAISMSSLGMSVQASAETAPQVVKYDDLDLASAQGQKKLHTRLKSAVRKVCVIPVITGSRVTQYDNACIASEMAKVEQKANVAIAAYKSQRGLASNNDAIVGN